MALTRKFLTALGIDSDKVDEIISAHSETVDALKQQRDDFKAESEKYKADAEKLPTVQKELDDLKAANEADASSYKAKYEKEHSDFEAFKNEQTAKETKAKITEAYKALLKEQGIPEKHLNAVLKASDLSAVELDENGKIKDSDKAAESIKTEWSDFITTGSSKGAETAKPPENNGGGTHHGTGRAAQIAAQYQANLYGTPQNSNAGNNGNASGNDN